VALEDIHNPTGQSEKQSEIRPERQSEFYSVRFQEILQNIQVQFPLPSETEDLVIRFTGVWRKRHFLVLKLLEETNISASSAQEEKLHNCLKDLLRARQRDISTIRQTLMRLCLGKKDQDQCRHFLLEFFAHHDLLFRGIVLSERNTLKGELSKAFEAKRVISAYAQTMQYRGE
jgi:hypothetical protein